MGRGGSYTRYKYDNWIEFETGTGCPDFPCACSYVGCHRLHVGCCAATFTCMQKGCTCMACNMEHDCCIKCNQWGGFVHRPLFCLLGGLCGALLDATVNLGYLALFGCFWCPTSPTARSSCGFLGCFPSVRGSPTGVGLTGRLQQYQAQFRKVGQECEDYTEKVYVKDYLTDALGNKIQRGGHYEDRTRTRVLRSWDEDEIEGRDWAINSCSTCLHAAFCVYSVEGRAKTLPFCCFEPEPCRLTEVPDAQEPQARHDNPVQDLQPSLDEQQAPQPASTGGGEVTLSASAIHAPPPPPRDHAVPH